MRKLKSMLLVVGIAAFATVATGCAVAPVLVAGCGGRGWVRAHYGVRGYWHPGHCG